MKICSRCIYDENISGISFNEYGVCNYCEQINHLAEKFGTGKDKGKRLLEKLVTNIKESGKNRKYDCVIGVSGGTDSSFMLMKALEWGLRPLAVHYDNTWNTSIASQNIFHITKAANVDLSTHVVDNVEVDDIKRSFLLSGVPEFDADTDIAFVQVLRSTAAKYRIKYILEGHSFMTEGISPVGSSIYYDGKYIQDIHEKFGNYPMKTFPNLTLSRFLKWTILYGQQFVRPLWYLDYNKEAAREFLTKNTGWKYYGGHHLENRASTFAHTIWHPRRYNTDFRILSLAASARNGHLSRKHALDSYREKTTVDSSLIEFVIKRTGLSQEEFEQLINAPKRTWRDFKNYRKTFQNLRPLFYLLSRYGRVPLSFYLKYCFPADQVGS